MNQGVHRTPWMLYDSFSSGKHPMHVITATQDKILQTAHVLTWDVVDGDWIRQFNRSSEGAEILRVIVRDGLEGADKIVKALWINL